MTKTPTNDQQMGLGKFIRYPINNTFKTQLNPT